MHRAVGKHMSCTCNVMYILTELSDLYEFSSQAAMAQPSLDTPSDFYSTFVPLHVCPNVSVTNTMAQSSRCTLGFVLCMCMHLCDSCASKSVMWQCMAWKFNSKVYASGLVSKWVSLQSFNVVLLGLWLQDSWLPF